MNIRPAAAFTVLIRHGLSLQRLHEGVVRDLERLERRKENLRLLEEQRSLTRRLEEQRHRRETQLNPQDT